MFGGVGVWSGIPTDCPFMVERDIYGSFDRLVRSSDMVTENIISSWASSVTGNPHLITTGRIRITG